MGTPFKFRIIILSGIYHADANHVYVYCPQSCVTCVSNDFLNQVILSEAIDPNNPSTE